MSEPITFLEFCTDNGLDRGAMRAACVEFVEQQTEIFSSDEMYELLLKNVEASGDIDRLLYQFEGNPEYSDTAGLIILVAAWNNMPQKEAVKAALLSGKESTAQSSDHQFAVAVIAGIYLLVRMGIRELKELPYRDAQGVWHTMTTEEGMPIMDLLYRVRDLFEG